MEDGLTLEEYRRLRAMIGKQRLWFDPGEAARPIAPALAALGWTVDAEATIRPLAGLSIRQHGVKRLAICKGAPRGVRRAVIAHTLAHEVLGHEWEMDLIGSSGVRRLTGNPGVHPADDRAATLASSIILIPEWCVTDGMTASEIAAWCDVSTRLAARRLAGVVIESDAPPCVIRIDRRGPDRLWGGGEARVENVDTGA